MRTDVDGPTGDRPGSSRTRTWLGLDEAGRGSVLGPLVVGGFLCAAVTAERLAPLGVRDSKLLSPERRRELFRDLGPLGRRFRVTFAPSSIDRAVRHNGLNRLEAEGFARIIRAARPDRVFLDACEVDAARFGREVAARASFRGSMDARNHADRDLPIVGAASIVAKVHRDAAVTGLARRVGSPVGSGYPSDPATRSYLEGALRPGRPVPQWVRASWKTTATVMARQTRTTLDRFAP